MPSWFLFILDRIVLLNLIRFFLRIGLLIFFSTEHYYLDKLTRCKSVNSFQQDMNKQQPSLTHYTVEPEKVGKLAISCNAELSGRFSVKKAAQKQKVLFSRCFTLNIEFFFPVVVDCQNDTGLSRVITVVVDR